MPLHTSSSQPNWSVVDANEIGTAIGIDWESAEFSPEVFLEGLLVELEHGTRDDRTDVTSDDPDLTGKIAWAHLLEDPAYYVVLKAVEERVRAKEREAWPEPFLAIHDLEQTLAAVTSRYVLLKRHRVKILRRAKALAATIVGLEPGHLENETILHRLADNALTAAEHLEDLASIVPELREHRVVLAQYHLMPRKI